MFPSAYRCFLSGFLHLSWENAAWSLTLADSLCHHTRDGEQELNLPQHGRKPGLSRAKSSEVFLVIQPRAAYFCFGNLRYENQEC